MDQQELTNIKVLIAGRPYPVKVNKGDEEAIRKIVKEVNDKINHFQMNYNKKDKQDCLSLTLLTYAVELHKHQKGELQADHNVSHNLDNDFSNKIHQLDELLDGFLS